MLFARASLAKRELSMASPPSPILPSPLPFIASFPMHALSQTLMGRQTDSLAWIEQGVQPPTPPCVSQKIKPDSPIPLPSHTASTHSCSPRCWGVLRGSQTPSTLQPLSLTLHKLGPSPWCLVSRSGHPWPRVCRLPICCSFSPHAVTFCLPSSPTPPPPPSTVFCRSSTANRAPFFTSHHHPWSVFLPNIAIASSPASFSSIRHFLLSFFFFTP